VDPFLQLATTWRQGFAGKLLAEQLRRWGEGEQALRRFGGQPELLFAFLRTEPSAERDAVFCALLRLAKGEQLAGLVVLEALLPGLKASLARTFVAAGESDELLALMLANAWAQIVGYPVERRPSRVAANLLLDIRKQTLRQLPRHRHQPTRARARARARREQTDGGERSRAAIAARGRCRRPERGGGGSDLAHPRRRRAAAPARREAGRRLHHPLPAAGARGTALAAVSRQACKEAWP
jgi:hypothetical protein